MFQQSCRLKLVHKQNPDINKTVVKIQQNLIHNTGLILRDSSFQQQTKENQRQATEQILVFNHRPFTKALGLISEQ